MFGADNFLEAFLNIHSLMVWLPHSPRISTRFILEVLHCGNSFSFIMSPKVCRSFLNLMIHRIFCVSLVSSFFPSKSPLQSREYIPFSCADANGALRPFTERGGLFQDGDLTMGDALLSSNSSKLSKISVFWVGERVVAI